ncbi:MAG: heavy metal-associated domain-containing protein [Pseudomonadota bacterium]
MSIVKERFAVTGMHCGSCAVSVGMVLRKIDGVVAAHVDFASKSVQIEYDGAQTNLADMNKAVERLGYNITRQ